MTKAWGEGDAAERMAESAGIEIHESGGGSAAQDLLSAAAPLPLRRVLIVDDAPMNRELVAIMLATAGYELDFAEDGANAVEKAAAQPYDLILMDMQMPVMDGPAAARSIRASGGPNAVTAIVAVSANVMPIHLQACLDAGMDDHIAKPIGSNSLITKTAQWIGRAHGRAA